MLMTRARNIRHFREARASLTTLCHDSAATIILDRNRPTAILVPIDTVGMSNPGPKDRRIATARKLFAAALDHIRAA